MFFSFLPKGRGWGGVSVLELGGLQGMLVSEVVGLQGVAVFEVLVVAEEACRYLGWEGCRYLWWEGCRCCQYRK